MTVEQSVEAGTKIIIRLALLAALLFFLYLIRDVVLLTFLSVLTAAALSPAIRRIRHLGLSRAPAVVITYSTVLLGLIAILSYLTPIFFEELRSFAETSSAYTERLDRIFSALENNLQPFGITFERTSFFEGVEERVNESLSGLFSTTVNFFSLLVSIAGFFFLALYLSLEEKGIEKFFLLLTPARYHSYALSIAERMQGKVSQWLFGQLLLMLLIFVIYFAGLSLLGVPYALALAFFGALLEIIPYIGPIIASVPALILGFLVSPVLGFSVAAFYIIVHQIEGHIIAPQVLKRSIGLNPVVLIISVLVGAKIGGALGVLIAIPTVMMLSVFVEDFLEKKTHSTAA